MRRRLRKLKILKVFDPTPEHVVKPHHFCRIKTSQAYKNDLLLFQLQICESNSNK